MKYFIIRAHYLSFKIFFSLSRIIRSVQLFIEIIWLSILDKKSFQQINDFFYKKTKYYHKKRHNLRGLYDWETKAIDTYFSDCKTLLIPGAGAGREIIALTKKGFQIDGYDCNARLVESGKKIISEAGLNVDIHHVPSQTCINNDKIYDGIIVGWGAYTNIQGRENRISFLKNLRKKLNKNSPLLVSFLTRNDQIKTYEKITKYVNTFRKFCGRDKIEIGDRLAPNYMHFFIQSEIEYELTGADFKLVYYNTTQYGHVVAQAI